MISPFSSSRARIAAAIPSRRCWRLSSSRGRRDPFGDEPLDPPLVARDRGELRPQARDLLAARLLARAALLHLPLEIGGVLGETGLLDPGDRLAGANRIAFVRNRTDEPAAARRE